MDIDRLRQCAVILGPAGHPINQTVTVMKAFSPVSRTNRSQRDNQCGDRCHQSESIRIRYTDRSRPCFSTWKIYGVNVLTPLRSSSGRTERKMVGGGCGESIEKAKSPFNPLQSKSPPLYRRPPFHSLIRYASHSSRRVGNPG